MLLKLNTKEHYDIVEELDRLTGNNVLFWLDTDMAYGLFDEDELIGYLTLGYADDCSEAIESHPSHYSDARVLSNVYVKDSHRNKGYATDMIERSIEDASEVTFLMLLDEGLIDFYERLDFKTIGDLAMIRI